MPHDSKDEYLIGVKPGDIAIHKKTDTIYSVFDVGKYKHDGVWYEAVFYRCKKGFSYARSLDNFKDSFNVYVKIGGKTL
jgi:hypothetical protein